MSEEKEQFDGSNFVRVDVPAAGETQAFTKLFGNGAIFCITPVTEETARLKAASFRNVPVDTWDIEKQLPALRQRGLTFDSDDDPDDYCPDCRREYRACDCGFSE